MADHGSENLKINKLNSKKNVTLEISQWTLNQSSFYLSNLFLSILWTNMKFTDFTRFT